MARPLLIAFFVVLAGCPSASDETNVVDECSKTGVQCRMGGGKLGVCMMNTDGAFDCVSQH